MSKILRAKILANKPIAQNIYQLGLKISRNLKLSPGQFFMVRVKDDLEPLLNRPLSWFEYHSAKHYLSFVYQIVGRGTKILSQRRPNEELSIIGPLGKGFELKPVKGRILLVAGGVGMAGLWSLLERLKEKANCSVNLVWGVRNKKQFYLLTRIPKPIKVFLATEDGSAGKKGLATDLAEKNLEKDKLDYIFACGPKAMLKRLAELSGKYKISGYLLYEERMACGIGACLGCAVPDKNGGYLKACEDGPVFRFDEIDWDKVK